MSALLPVYERDLTIVSGKGSYLLDALGRRYLDFAAGIGVNGLGYGDRGVIAAIRRQTGRLIHASNLYFTEPVVALAERLVALSFPSSVFFANSGTEAVEAAIKFARRIGKAQGRTELLAFEGSFHGRTLGALSLTWKAKYREPFEPLVPGAHFLPWNDVGAVDAAVNEKTAAVFVEPVQGEGGIRLAQGAFLKGVADICRRRGALLVCDEIQCGLGRTGTLFAYEHFGVQPDLLTLAKPLGGGLPLGAVLLREDLAGALAVGEHGSTFGGNPVAAAAALSVLDRLTAPGFLQKVGRKGDQLRKGLRSLARAYPRAIAEVRGLGLMVGVEFHASASDVVKGLRDRGVLATKAGDTVLRLLPPLTIKGPEIRAFLSVLESVLMGGAGAPATEGGGVATA